MSVAEQRQAGQGAVRAKESRSLPSQCKRPAHRPPNTRGSPCTADTNPPTGGFSAADSPVPLRCNVGAAQRTARRRTTQLSESIAPVDCVEISAAVRGLVVGTGAALPSRTVGCLEAVRHLRSRKPLKS